MILLFALLIFLLDVGTGILVPLKTNSLKSIYIKKPSVFVGDFLIIPSIGGYILNLFYQRRSEFSDFFSPLLLVVIGTVSVMLALISALRFKTTSVWYWPHSVFYAFMAFWILLFLIGRLDLTALSWWLVIAGIGAHFYLGKKYPKVFPKINEAGKTGPTSHRG